MKKVFLTWIVLCLLLLSACDNGSQKNRNDMENFHFITQQQINDVIDQLKKEQNEANAFRMERSVTQVANLWRESDGSADEFMQFCQSSFIADADELKTLFTTLEHNFEILYGYFHKIDAGLKMQLHVEGPPIESVDMMFGSYNAAAHLNDDMYASKIAFLTALNFPFYTLEEKTELGKDWSRLEWAYARMGDRFTSRVPARITQNISKTLTEADAYISDYNIYMGQLQTDDGRHLFPEDMKLITHWGLRDELKSNYDDNENGLEKQRMVYRVMQRIIDQSIPEKIINNGTLSWNPFSNQVFENGTEQSASPEPDKRYEIFLRNFHAMRSLDDFSSDYPTQLIRAFDAVMEIPQKDVEQLFVTLLSSPEVKEVAAFIKSRLGRDLEPFDIWYNGFKARGGYPEDQLTAITEEKYPNAAALKADLPNILVKLGWDPQRAGAITSLIEVDPSRGAGHAMGSAMRNDFARLRTRIGTDGMDYKGYNIAVHEFGHNVEQTITMNDVDYYMLNGVPNTSFTEATAFMFQKRDLELLGLKDPNPDDKHYLALDNFWSCYEIMGVSLVDIRVWEWLYENPDAAPADLKAAVMRIAKEVWNSYYAGILGDEDETLLGIYSHMIDYPLYLPNYPMGHLIDFQIEQQVSGKNIADEVERMYTQGRIVPQRWMEGAVGSAISVDPLLSSVRAAIEVLNKW